MLSSVEAVIDEKGTVCLLEPVELATARRAIVTILKDEFRDLIEVQFMHPSDSAMTLTADIALLCTGQEALQELLRNEDGKGAFLSPLPEGQVYDLSVHRTQQAITQNGTFAQAGVVAGDTIDVGHTASGGGYNFNEIAEILLKSGVTLAFIKAVTQIIVQLLKNKESSSIRFRCDDAGEAREIEIKGSNSVDDLVEAALIMERHRINLQQPSGDSQQDEESALQNNLSEPQMEKTKVDDGISDPHLRTKE